jgi:hypothetical protein
MAETALPRDETGDFCTTENFPDASGTPLSLSLKRGDTGDTGAVGFRQSSISLSPFLGLVGAHADIHDARMFQGDMWATASNDFSSNREREGTRLPPSAAGSGPLGHENAPGGLPSPDGGHSITPQAEMALRCLRAETS